jgi:hypothetical protein
MSISSLLPVQARVICYSLHHKYAKNKKSPPGYSPEKVQVIHHDYLSPPFPITEDVSIFSPICYSNILLMVYPDGCQIMLKEIENADS